MIRVWTAWWKHNDIDINNGCDLHSWTQNPPHFRPFGTVTHQTSVDIDWISLNLEFGYRCIMSYFVVLIPLRSARHQIHLGEIVCMKHATVFLHVCFIFYLYIIYIFMMKTQFWIYMFGCMIGQWFHSMMAESAQDGGSGSPLDLLKRFYALQEERVEAYRFLERWSSQHTPLFIHWNALAIPLPLIYNILMGPFPPKASPEENII